MWNHKIIINILLSVLLLSLPVSSYAMESETYSITESELNQLNGIFQNLKINLELQSTESTRQKNELMTLNQQVDELSNQLIQAKESNKIAKDSLTKANEYLKVYEGEEKAKISKLKRERNTWIIVSGVVAALAITK